MDKTIMTYTLLKEYNKIDTLISNLSSNIMICAVHSYSESDDVFTRVCDLLECKRVLYNVKTIVKQAVKKLTPFEKAVFNRSFVKGERALSIAEDLNVNKMQVYRTIRTLPSRVLSLFKESGTYFDEFCADDYTKAKFIKSAYEKNIKSAYEKNMKSAKKLIA